MTIQTREDELLDDDLDASQQADGLPGDDTEQQADANTSDAGDQADTAAGDDTTQDDDGDQPETFPREYVEKLRKESAGYRERAQQADVLAQRLHTALVAATGRLADPTDLPFDAEHLDDSDALNAAIDALVERKPHLKSRRVVGDVGQGAGAVKAGQVNLAEILRARA
ncbi:hypothetical protein [Mycolicibacterium iranicum]|uniref:hypothetical protein n=1 Tax=Mycolicibacterium iranicum TaxID=912594 RepID=UPI000467D164|nr:hypothetical protein [Mycolicibacterium iranicum]